MERDGDITFCRRIFSVSQFRNFTLGNPRCFTKLLAAKKLDGCEWGYQVFPSNFFNLTLPKSFIGNSLVLQKSSGSEIIGWMREGDTTFSRQKSFESQYRRFSLITLRGFRYFPVWEEIYVQDGGSRKVLAAKNFINAMGFHVFPSNFLRAYYRKLSLGNLRCFRKRLAAKTIYGSEGDITFFWSKFFCVTFPKNVIRNSSHLQKNSGIAKFTDARARITFYCRNFFASFY